VDDKIDFITYCIEEYKEHENLTGREVIDLFTRYDIIPYIKSAYSALHVMGGTAIAGEEQPDERRSGGGEMINGTS
jgi:hypothetical protein